MDDPRREAQKLGDTGEVRREDGPGQAKMWIMLFRSV